MSLILKRLYEWLDLGWGWLSEKIFIRFEFDLPLELVRDHHQKSPVCFALTRGGLVEWLILSSWCRRHGLGAILVCNRLRILWLAKPLYFLQILFRTRTYADLFLNQERGPRLIFCPASDRRRPFEPVPVERLLSSIYLTAKAPENLIIFPVLILWRKHVRSEKRSLSEYLLGLASSPNLIGKLWYLFRKRKDSVVRSLAPLSFDRMESAEALALMGDSEASWAAKTLRRKILVGISDEMRVTLGPRYESPHSVKESLLRDPQFREELDKLALEEGVDPKKLLMRGYKNLTEIVANRQYRTIEVLYVFLTWLFTRVFDGVNVLEGQMQELRGLVRRKSVVYVCCHRSHLDYLVMPYVLFVRDMVPPHIAAGINLAFWPVGGLLRSAGAFFIRRSFRGDKVYRLCLKSYIGYLLKHRHNFSFFIEGTRSRTGKMLAPAYGLLKNVLESYEGQKVEDIAFVPVSIAYDEVLEEKSYQQEMAGEKKITESVWSLFRARKVVHRRIGGVYVRLGEPLLASEIHTVWHSKLSVEKSAFEICKRISDVTPVTPRAIVSTVLLCHPETPLSLEKTLEVSLQLGEFLQRVSLPLSVPLDESFSGALEKTLKSLKRSGVIEVDENTVPRKYYCPGRRRKTLNYYKNNGLHCFVLPSILFHSVVLTRRHTGETADPRAFWDEVSSVALELRNLLKFEFFFSPSKKFLEEMERVADYYFGEHRREQSIHKLWEKFQQGSQTHAIVSLYLRVLADLLESYVTALMAIKQIEEVEIEKKALSQKILRFAEGMATEGRVHFPESLVLQNYSNAVELLTNLNLVSVSQETQKSMVKLPRWNDPLEKLYNRLLQFCASTLIRE